MEVLCVSEGGGDHSDVQIQELETPHLEGDSLVIDELSPQFGCAHHQSPCTSPGQDSLMS